jgi:hypothetical protein
MDEDFETLKNNGIDIKGKVVICRYGKIFRGNKVKFKFRIIIIKFKKLEFLLIKRLNSLRNMEL